jgi:ferritin-like metal-binding protein YciE
MKIQSLQDLFVDELRDLYNAENQLVKALPKMAKSANSTDLQEAIEEHLEQTKGHVERLEQIFEKLELSPKGKKCLGMQGLIEEGKEVLSEDMEDNVLDAAIIAAAQRVEHYEMAGYGTARTFAKMLGQKEAARLLQETLDEESEANEKLTQLAESHINAEAANPA